MRDVDGVVVWTVRLEAIDPSGLPDTYLSPSEQLEHGRFATENLQHEYAVTRALCRLVLSHHSSVPTDPSRWMFERTDAGKPYVVGPEAKHAPCFSLSNADGLVVCAVSAPTVDVGVDVEPVHRRDLLEIASDIFSDAERASLAALPNETARQRHAIELWTLKEAYLKARGVGIGTRLHRVEPLGEEAQREWQIETLAPSTGIASSDFIVAVAARRKEVDQRHHVTVNERADSLFYPMRASSS